MTDPVIMDVPGYKSLAQALLGAYEQAHDGKGKERHASGEPFDQQPIITLGEMTGTGGLIFQVMKKARESQRLQHHAAIRELRGVINYAAAAIILLERQHARSSQDKAAT